MMYSVCQIKEKKKKKHSNNNESSSQSVLNLWSVRGVTLLGKITVLKTLVILKIIHKTSYLTMHFPEAFVKQLDKFMFKFIWDFKWEKISKSKLCCNIEDGGSKMINAKQYFFNLKFRWNCKVFDKADLASWKIIENVCLFANLFFCVLRSNCKPSGMIVNNLISL